MSRFARHTIVFSSLTLLSRITGLLRVMAFAAAFSLSRFNDAYNLAGTIPHMIYEFVMGGLLSATLIPLLIEQQQKHGKTSREAWGAANLLLGMVGVILAVVSLLVLALAPQLVDLMTFVAPKHSMGASKELATFFLRYFAPQMLFYGLSAVFMAILNAHEVFAITAAAPIVNNVVAIASVVGYYFGLLNETGLALGTTAGVVAMALVQLPSLVKLGMPLRPRFNFRDPLFASAATLAAPMFIVGAANFIGTAVRANLLYTTEGGYTTQYFAFILIMMPYGIFAVSVATVLFPALTKNASAGDMGEYRGVLSLGLRWTFMAMLPVAIGMSVLSEPITRVLFERGNFTYRNSLQFESYLSWYALSILPYALMIFATRGFYALKDTRTPAWINVGGVALNIALNIILLRSMGVNGIALSAVVTYTATAIISFVILFGRSGGLHHAVNFVPLAKIAAAGAIMALIVYYANAFTEPSVVQIEKGSRSPLELPQTSAGSGNVVLVRNANDWKTLATAMDLDSSATAPARFADETIAVFFAPQASTTTTLQLAGFDAGTTSAVATVSVYGTNTTSTRSLAPFSSYLVTLIRQPVPAVTPRFVITGKPLPQRFQRVLRAPDLGRLCLLIPFGTAAYFAAAFALRCEELRFLRNLIERKRRR